MGSSFQGGGAFTHQPQTRLDFSWAGSIQEEVVRTPVGCDYHQSTLSEDEDHRDINAGGIDHAAGGAGPNEVFAGIDEDNVGFWGVHER